jgi:hypothetical protein
VTVALVRGTSSRVDQYLVGHYMSLTHAYNMLD